MKFSPLSGWLSIWLILLGETMLIFDGCCGTKSVSRIFAQRGWDAITLDIDQRFKPDIVADIRDYKYEGPRPDLMWFSPPCDEFAREFMPWCRTGKAPDLSIVKACIAIAETVQPRYWVIENVIGAQTWFRPFLGEPRYKNRPIYLWGFFPEIRAYFKPKNKESMSSARAIERAMIPPELSVALACAVERQAALL